MYNVLIDEQNMVKLFKQYKKQKLHESLIIQKHKQ